MPKTFIRIELIDKPLSEYEPLHKELAKRGIGQVIQDGGTGPHFALPPGMYWSPTISDANTAVNEAVQAAEAAGVRKADVRVAAVAYERGITHTYNLKKVEPIR